MITRSSSTGVLNQSDSENEGEKKRQSRLMRPTISSQNKITNSKTMLNRKRQSHSTSKTFPTFHFYQQNNMCIFIVNLLSVGQNELSTSDDEEKIKPTVPPRTRLSCGENAIKRHQNIKDKPKVTNRNAINEIRKKSDDLDRTLTNDFQDYDSLDVSTVQCK